MCSLTHWGRVTHICVSNLTIQCWIIINWTLRNKLQWNIHRNSNLFIQENAFESVVCETAVILSRPQCVKSNNTLTHTCVDNFCLLLPSPHQLQSHPSFGPYRCRFQWLISRWFLLPRNKCYCRNFYTELKIICVELGIFQIPLKMMSWLK